MWCRDSVPKNPASSESPMKPSSVTKCRMATRTRIVPLLSSEVRRGLAPLGVVTTRILKSFGEGVNTRTPAWRDAPPIDRLPGSPRTRMLRCHMAIQEVDSSTELPHRAAWPRCRLLFLLPVLLPFAGCMVGPNYQRPKVSVSPSFGETGDPRLSAESTNYRDWWKAFNDPARDRLIARAYRDNLTLQQAGVRVLQARAQLGIAVGEIFPQTQQAIGSVQYNRTSDRAATAAFFKGGGSIEYWQSTIGAQASWELDFWGRIRRGIQSADASLLATLADYDNTLVTLTADVANTYIALRTAEERIRIARENIEIQQQTLQIVEARFKYGTVTSAARQRARTVLLNTQATLPTLETQRRQARDALAVLLGMAPNDLGDLLDGPSAIPVSPPQVIVCIPSGLLRRRPDIRSAELQAIAQSAQIGVAKADLLPAFSLI